ncbi:NAD(P)/FAD-dependent oxidoreductase [Streptomyces sp. NPDC004126]|uniref:NAD(P)/FAD-dependent oxidoreductase n=1 Tax=Streptomyces sp. NPDC004126 TaxID=3390695 RepID=UPI003D065934
MPHLTHTPARPARRRAIVIGGSLAGTLAAAALREAVEEVLIVENDELPTGPGPRRGLPQASHAHMFWSTGVHATEALLPGATGRWMSAGANRIPIPTGMVGFTPEGWLRRWSAETAFLIACSRGVLDHAVRDLLLADPAVTVLQRTRVDALTGTADRVTGVRTRGADGREEVLEADFVVDASGRGSRAPRHLEDLGVKPAPERSLDLGLTYASRIFRAPEGTTGFPLVVVQSDPRTARPGQSASILPIEDGQWIVTTAGTRGGEPTASSEDFEPFARGLRHPLVGEMISGLEPLTGVTVSRSTRNVRRYFENVRNWPERYVVLGDALAAFNPIYGHAMSVAAQSALVLRDLVSAHGIDAPRLARRVQKAVAGPVAAAWDLALGHDVFYPGVQGSGHRTPTLKDKLVSGYTYRLLNTCCGSFSMTRDFFDVTSLQAPLTTLVRPRVLLGALRGPLRPPLTGPPLTPDERALVHRGCGVREFADRAPGETVV